MAESERLSRKVISKFEKSEDKTERFEAVHALLALSDAPDSNERSRAFRILEGLLGSQPDHPEYRFLYAVLLSGNPRLHNSLRIPGVEPNAVKLLTRLAEDHPERPEYGLALLDIARRKFRLRRASRSESFGEDEAIQLSIRMLGCWPNDPQIVSAVVNLHSGYIDFLRKQGEEKKIRKENERLLGILEVLFYNPDISDTVKEELIQLQLRRLRMLRRHSLGTDVEDLTDKIKRELENYRGPRRDEFRNQLDDKE